MRPNLTPRRIAVARMLAVGIDLVQVAFLPAFFPGAASPASTVIDFVAAALMIGLVGWHWAFVPTFAIELLPVADLAPTWTAAVLLATYGRADDDGTDAATGGGRTPPRLPGDHGSDSGS